MGEGSGVKAGEPPGDRRRERRPLGPVGQRLQDLGRESASQRSR